MNRADVITIAKKDLRTALRRRGLRAGLFLFPVVLAVGFSLLIRYSNIPAAVLPHLLISFLFFFIVGAATLPTAIAAYSFVGEKVERSLEPLLATPVADLDILVGKSLGALIPPVIASWVGGALFMIISGRETSRMVGTTYLPDSTAWIILGLVIPLSSVLSVLVSVLVSARATDTRSAQQAAGLLALPFAAIYVLSEIRIITLDPPGMLLLAAVLAGMDVVLFVLARAAFDREEILTRWR